jgi:HAD superfamily hydrolase (TIGR01509 family)
MRGTGGGTSMIESVIFDFDGLILDTESTLRRSWEEIYAEHGLLVPETAWASWVGSSADPPEAYEELERHLGRPIDRRVIRNRRMARELELLGHEPPMPGVRGLIDAARDRGLRLAIASSSDRAWVRGHLERLALLDRFEAIASADDVAATKPAPDLYRMVLAGLGVRPEQAIALEDSAHGVAAAVAAGLFCVAVPNCVTRHSAFDAADLVIESLAGCTLDALLRAAEAANRGR